MPVYDNFYKPPYPEGEFDFVHGGSGGKALATIEDFDPPIVLHIRNFIPTLETTDLTLKDLEYHTMRYLDGLPLNRLTQKVSKTVGSENWYGRGLTQEDLNEIPPPGYTQEDLNLLTQHGIEQSPGIGPKTYLPGEKGALGLTILPGESETYSSIYEDDNLMATPFDDPLGDYLIQFYAWVGEGKASGTGLGSQVDLESSYISFSSSLNNDPAQTDTLSFSDMDITTASANFSPPYDIDACAILNFNRDLLVNSDPSRIKRIDIKVAALADNTDPMEFGMMDLRMFNPGSVKYPIGIDTKKGALVKVNWLDPEIVEDDYLPIYNLGQNKARDYTLYAKISPPITSDGPSSPSVEFSFYHRINDAGVPALRVAVSFSFGNLLSVGIQTVSDDPGMLDGPYYTHSWDQATAKDKLLVQMDLESDLARVLIWSLGPGETKDRILFNSQEFQPQIQVPSRAGRIAAGFGSVDGWQSWTHNTSAKLHYLFSRDTVLGEMKTSRFNTVTPLLGATLYVNSSPPIQQIQDYYSGQEGESINHLGSPEKESGNNNGGFEIIPGGNDLTVSLDTSRTYGGLPSYRVRKHSNAYIGGVQWGETIRVSDPARSSVEGAIRFDNNVIGGSFRVVLWDEHFKNVQLILPIVIEDTPGKWHNFKIPIATETLMSLDYRVQVQHVGPTNGVGSFWLGGFKIQTETVEWALSNDAGNKFVSATEALNTPFSSVNFVKPGRHLIARARAYHPKAWINRFEITPRWDESGVVILPEELNLTYKSLPEIQGLNTYEDIPDFFESYSDMED